MGTNRRFQRRFSARPARTGPDLRARRTFGTPAGITVWYRSVAGPDRRRSGENVARASARQLVVYHRRAGGQSQFSALLDIEGGRQVRRAVAMAGEVAATAVEDLATQAAMSQRNFARAWRDR